MTIFQAVLLGLLQGIAEFLPISSSGHLAVAQYLFALADLPVLYDVFLHLATLAAVFLYFRKKIWTLLCALFRWVCRKSAPGDSASLSMIAALLAGTAVTAVFGLALEKVIPQMPVKAVCGGFIVTALVLIVSGKLAAKRVVAAGKGRPSAGSVSVKQGLITGLAQGIGVLPGISRSGATISGALLAGVDRKTAGEFSFLLSIPSILGAFVLELRHLDALSGAVSGPTMLAGCAVAFASGLVSLAFLMRLIQKGNLAWFAVYLIPLGIAGIVLL
jgi:undecaprenyl-diphosphatase